MNYSQSLVPQLFTSLNQDFTSSKNDLLDAIDIIIKNTKEAIKNSQSKMESCIDAIINDYVTFQIPPESSVDPCKPIEQYVLDEYNKCLYNLYVRANVISNKMADNYEVQRLIVNKMVHDLKKKIEMFYNEIQINLQTVLLNSRQEDMLVKLKNHEKVHIKKCNKFKGEVNKIFYKINRICLHNTQEFDKNINKVISTITQDHIVILEKYIIIKMTMCNLQLTAN